MPYGNVLCEGHHNLGPEQISLDVPSPCEASKLPSLPLTVGHVPLGFVFFSGIDNDSLQ